MNMPMTDKVRWVMVALFAITVLTACAGWLALRDVSQMGDLLMWQAMGVGIGEASAVGKRATSKSDVMAAETAQRMSGAYTKPAGA